MKHLKKYVNDGKTYMFPTARLATPEVILEDYPAILTFTHIIETDAADEVIFAVQNLNALRGMYDIDPELTEDEAISTIQEIINTPPEPPTGQGDPLAGALNSLAGAISVITGEMPIPADDDLYGWQEYKLAEIGAACTEAIAEGVTVTTSQGAEQFALTLEDQTNLAHIMLLIKSGVEEVRYHADKDLCRLYTADEIRAIMQAATIHKTWHLTYCNHLNVLIRRTDDVLELKAICYGMDLPPDLQANFDEIMEALDGSLGALTSP